MVCFRSIEVCVILQIDSDKTIMVTFKHDDKLQEGFECAFQVVINAFIFFPIL